MSSTDVRTSFTNRSSGLKTIPSVHTYNPLGSTLAFQRDPLGFLSRIVHQYGDIVQFRLLTIPMIVINHPEYFKRVLVDNNQNYDKDAFLFKVVRPVLRNGLIGNPGGESWLRQRRLMQPAFHRQSIAKFAENMTSKTLEMLQRWKQKVAQGRVINVTDEMGNLALQIVNKSLFSVDVGDKVRIFEQAFTEANTILGAFARFPFPPLSVPTLSHRQLRAAIRSLDEFVSLVIHQRLQSKENYDDLLSMLMHAVDEETGEGMSIEQLHHEVLNIMVGAYETTTNTLSWIWYLLAQHHDVEQRLHTELDTVLAGRVPTIDDIPHLPYTRMIIDETLRLYSPAWQTMRRAREEDKINGYYIPAHAIIFLNHHTLHRHPNFWDDPERFAPERFSPEQIAKRPRYTYIPFSSGPRTCIGNNFALTEIQLILSTIAQHYRLVLLSGYPPVEKLALISLHPKNGVRVRLEHR
ncbi:cytochrome P450 [Pelatocladus sp. BLCC-F211]|uniref:cytochrome P450 n=1 Tax=Pelatocladus sp. BLCC-F211 TaxID=3342752 RepID=UPI0035B88F60